MHIPETPPPLPRFFDILKELSPSQQEQWLNIAVVDEKGEYLHWDDVKHRPPPFGFTPLLWWAGIRYKRRSTQNTVPLLQDTRHQSFTFCEPPTIREHLVQLDRLFGSREGHNDVFIDKRSGEEYLERAILEEPYFSSVIEGAATTRDIAKQMVFEKRSPRTKDERMIYNNYRGMEFIKAHIDKPLSIQFILDLHRIITTETLDDPADSGRFRQRDDIQVWDEATGDMLHNPPSFREIADRMQVLCDFANAGDRSDVYIHPIIRAIILHFMLSYEHPFVDGNGRTARGLFYWCMLRSGYWVAEYLSISSVMKGALRQYGQAFLKVESDQSDLTYFVLHQLTVIKESYRRLYDYFKKKKADQSRFEHTLFAHPDLNDRQKQILFSLGRRYTDTVTYGSHMKRMDISYLTAQKDLRDLEAQKLLGSEKRGKEIHFFLLSPVNRQPDLTKEI